MSIVVVRIFLIVLVIFLIVLVIFLIVLVIFLIIFLVSKEISKRFVAEREAGGGCDRRQTWMTQSPWSPAVEET